MAFFSVFHIANVRELQDRMYRTVQYVSATNSPLGSPNVCLKVFSTWRSNVYLDPYRQLCTSGALLLLTHQTHVVHCYCSHTKHKPMNPVTFSAGSAVLRCCHWLIRSFSHKAWTWLKIHCNLSAFYWLSYMTVVITLFNIDSVIHSLLSFLLYVGSFL